jgi:hypothetical protein
LKQQIWSNSEILLAKNSLCLRFLAGVHVFEAAEIQIRHQILNPCLLLDSGLRDYEIKLDRREQVCSFYLQNSPGAADRKRALIFLRIPLKNRLTPKGAKSGQTQNRSLS